MSRIDFLRTSHFWILHLVLLIDFGVVHLTLDAQFTLVNSTGWFNSADQEHQLMNGFCLSESFGWTFAFILLTLYQYINDSTYSFGCNYEIIFPFSKQKNNLNQIPTSHLRLFITWYFINKFSIRFAINIIALLILFRLRKRILNYKMT